MFLNYVPMFLCGSKVTFIIRYQKFSVNFFFYLKFLLPQWRVSNRILGDAPLPHDALHGGRYGGRYDDYRGERHGCYGGYRGGRYGERGRLLFFRHDEHFRLSFFCIFPTNSRGREQFSIHNLLLFGCFPPCLCFLRLHVLL